MEDHDLWMAFFKDPAGNTSALMNEVPKGYTPFCLKEKHDAENRNERKPKVSLTYLAFILEWLFLAAAITLPQGPASVAGIPWSRGEGRNG